MRQRSDTQIQRLFILDGAGPALPIGDRTAAAMIQHALEGAGFGPAPGGGSAAGGGGAKVFLIAGAVIVAIAVALVAFVAVRHARDGESTTRIPLLAGSATTDASTTSPTAASHGSDATPDPVAAAEPQASDTDAIGSDDTIEIDAPSGSEAKPSKRVAPKRVEDLLAQANAKRAAKQWRDSDALYARVIAQVPKSLAAQTALVASGSLHLEHLDDPTGAATRFRRALAIAQNGALAEDARWGLAEAARVRGDKDAERAALDDFLAHHASSPLAPRAKLRRGQL